MSTPMRPPTPTPPKNSALKAAFGRVRDFALENPLQSGSILTAVLLGTTALVTPLLTSTVAAGAIMLGSCALLGQSSNALIDHTKAIGQKLRLSPMLIGLGLGVLTSAPELFVSLGAIAQGNAALGIGNVVGSNISNILFILGATAAICDLNKGVGKGWKFNAMAVLGATAGYAGLLATGNMNMFTGLGMLGLCGAYMVANHVISQRDLAAHPELRVTEKVETDPLHPGNMPTWFNAAWGVAGLGGVVYSADLLVNSASSFATGMGVSQALVGSLAVAVGTSVPELVVSIKAALKKEPDIALGNILGSNVFNILAVGGAVAVAGAAVPESFGLATAQGLLNLTAFGASAGLLAATLQKTGGALKRWHGMAALGLYGAFVAASMALDGGTAPPDRPLPAPVKATYVMPQDVIRPPAHPVLRAA